MNAFQIIVVAYLLSTLWAQWRYLEHREIMVEVTSNAEYPISTRSVAVALPVSWVSGYILVVYWATSNLIAA